jgi:hypothetical protein
MCVCMYVCKYVCVYVCIYVCVCVFTNITLIFCTAPMKHQFTVSVKVKAKLSLCFIFN